MVKITQCLTSVNRTKGNKGRKYIVIHYTGNRTDTAKANANYFKSMNRGASAHYFVDASSIYQVVSDNDSSWAVGKNYGKNNLFGKCTNENSISIEMCSKNGAIAAGTLKNTIELTRLLMARYNIPASNVVRHYDVCSKLCPGWTGWLPRNESIWKAFKAQLSPSIVVTTKPKGTATTTGYRVRVTADVLNIRKGAGTNFPVVGKIKDKGVYTIVSESTGQGAKEWGRLKSGAGWISLDYTKRI